MKAGNYSAAHDQLVYAIHDLSTVKPHSISLENSRSVKDPRRVGPGSPHPRIYLQVYDLLAKVAQASVNPGLFDRSGQTGPISLEDLVVFPTSETRFSAHTTNVAESEQSLSCGFHADLTITVLPLLWKISSSKTPIMRQRQSFWRCCSNAYAKMVWKQGLRRPLRIGFGSGRGWPMI